MNNLTKETIAEVLEAHKKYSTLSEQIDKRMKFILEFCINTVGGKLGWWDWEDEADFPNAYSPELLYIAGEWTCGDKMKFIDKNGEEQCFYSIPTRWLYEDFQDEFVNGIKLYKEKQQAKTKKKQQNRQNREKLIASAKAKLTAEELKAILKK